MPVGKGLAKRYKFSQEELKVVPKGKGLAKRYKFNKKKRLKVVRVEKKNIQQIKRVKSQQPKKVDYGTMLA